MAKANGNFAESSAECARVIDSLRGGAYAPLYLLHGVEGYFIDQIESYISENALSEDLRAFNQITLWGKETSGSEIVAAARQYPMMGNRQVVVVRDAQNAKGLDSLALYVAKPLPSTVLVICHRDKSMDKRSMLYKKFAANTSAVIFESIAPREWDIARFVGQIFAARGLTADEPAKQMIADHIGASLQRIDTEITKLATRLAPVNKVTAKDIEDNIGISKDFNNFELTKALSTRNFRAALTIADYFARNQKNNPLVLTLPTLFTHFQRIVTLNLYKWECARSHKVMGSDYDLARLLGLQSVYFLGEYQAAAANYPTAKAVEILGLIREWDMRSKGFSSSSDPSSDLLSELILRICAV
ncbi:MAG: DNA polymerase III subunit delta [Mucinivorans sp.]